MFDSSQDSSHVDVHDLVENSKVKVRDAWSSVARYPGIVVHHIQLLVLGDYKINCIRDIRFFCYITGNKGGIGSKLFRSFLAETVLYIAMTTLAPLLMNFSAVAFPIPLAAPVINATLRSSFL
ncbi:hypothetical protein J1N35_021062 [Gossypium stocksii]|uniref:Uncharacterized protein n=1 Tax=Gossypium stocksii TaxID=47602 RepID=A0A9D3VEG2_9ROSI|nr:hypothetical protein J1N35_021062 [Gossypium stocksii]